ncbi:MAG: Fic family protein [Proteobacteria bacterium]|nr:Fic family protein [Pseudomonadota bacterium]
MHSFEEIFLKSLSFNSEQLSVLKTIGEYRGKQELYFQQSPQVLESLKTTSIIESSESSNRIEGVIAPHHRIEELVLHNTTPKNRSEQEIAGYRDALSIIHESYESMPFTPNIILQLHSIIYKYQAGRGGNWKIADNEITETLPDGTKKIRFKPVSAIITPQAMEDLGEKYKKAKDQDIEPLIIIPLAILDFLCIHPFRDGNGRTGRLLTLLLLYHFNYEVGRFISLERVIEDSKETYYEALNKSSLHWHQGKHDVSPWLNYFWGMLLAAYKEFEERVGTIKRGKGFKTEHIQNVVESKVGEFSIADIEKSCPGTSRDMIRAILRKLRDQGKIKPIGTGRSAKWVKI